ncbi:MAG: septum formation initiator family protein [Acidobacteriota bacterium]
MTQKRHTLRHKKELYYIFLIVLVGGILVLSIFGPNGYLEMKKVEKELQGQQEKVQSLNRSNAERQKNIDALESEEGIEREAREQGYGRENEIIEHLPENPQQGR